MLPLHRGFLSKVKYAIRAKYVEWSYKAPTRQSGLSSPKQREASGMKLFDHRTTPTEASRGYLSYHP